MLASAQELHSTVGDDDRSAVTVWFKDLAVRDRFADAVAGALRGIER